MNEDKALRQMLTRKKQMLYGLMNYLTECNFSKRDV